LFGPARLAGHTTPGGCNNCTRRPSDLSPFLSRSKCVPVHCCCRVARSQY
jgi:hypothetical protein